MLNSFKKSNSDGDCEELKRTQKLLEINGMETLDLIHLVHLDLWNEQQILKDSPFGQLTVQTQFVDANTLKIRILNAKNLKAMDSSGTSDSYVRIHFLPEEKFTSVTKPKTQTKSKSLYPLFDETFVM